MAGAPPRPAFSRRDENPEAYMTSAITDTYSALNGSLVKMFDLNRAIVETTLRRTHEESLRFINHRLEQNTRALESLRDSQGVSGLIAAEHEWLADTARDYIEQTEKFGGLFLELATSSARNAAEEGRVSTESIKAAVNRDIEKAREHSQRQAAE
jgi:hypothetical protein